MYKINRKTADPDILRAYEELRHERRWPKLDQMVNIVRVVAYAGLLPIFFVPSGARPTYLYAWMGCVAPVIFMEFILMVAWQPSGKRLRAIALIAGAIGMGVAALAGLFFLMSLLF